MIEPEIRPTRDAAEMDAAAHRAAEVLRAGGLVVHPTETVYGIGGDGGPASNGSIARLKRRDPDQPLIVLVPDLARAQRLLPALDWPAGAERLARVFWPGPLTIVVRCPGAPAGLAGPDGGVALRVTSHGVLRRILAHWEGLLTSTSANLSGAPPPQSLGAALALFESRADLTDLLITVLAIDAGPSPGAEPSSIVSFVDAPPRLLREGAIAFEPLEGELSGLVR